MSEQSNTFEYSQDFKNLIVDLHRGKEQLASYENNVNSHLGGATSRIYGFLRCLVPEIRYHCGDLNSKRCLDFGCGTGATTAALAMNFDKIIAFDIDEKSIDICRKRLKEHQLLDRVQIICAPSIEAVTKEIGTFDFILLNGVIEHIPLSRPGLRQTVLSTLFDLLNPEGFLYISETPNRLWPQDRHTTKLWWIPWSKPGSKWAYNKAMRLGRHVESPATHSAGPLGLEERGTWGATFFEIRCYLSGKPYRVINSLPGHNRHLTYARPGSRKRQILESIVFYSFTKWTQIPITAFSTNISHLVIQKRS